MAMTEQELLDRISKCNERIEKLNKKIQKWEAKKSEEAFIKDHAPWESENPKTIKTMEDLIEAHWQRLNSRYPEYTKEEAEAAMRKAYEDWLESCDREIRSTNRDIADTQNTINTYNNRLELVREKNARPVIQIFKDFFESWKNEIIEWLEPKIDRYYELNSKAAELHNNRYSLVGPGKMFETKEEWEEEYKKLRSQEREIREISWVKIALDKGMSRRGLGDFEKYLNTYMNDRYDELVVKVTEHVGNITDVSDLHVGYDGGLNGIIIGDSGKAKVETIVAGGYNIQCRHYRCLVHKLKD